MIEVLLRRELRLPAMPDLPLALLVLLVGIFGMVILLYSPGTKVALRSSEAGSGSTRWGSWPTVEPSIPYVTKTEKKKAFDVLRLGKGKGNGSMKALKDIRCQRK